MAYGFGHTEYPDMDFVLVRQYQEDRIFFLFKEVGEEIKESLMKEVSLPAPLIWACKPGIDTTEDTADLRGGVGISLFEGALAQISVKVSTYHRVLRYFSSLLLEEKTQLSRQEILGLDDKKIKVIIWDIYTPFLQEFREKLEDLIQKALQAIQNTNLLKSSNISALQEHGFTKIPVNVKAYGDPLQPWLPKSFDKEPSWWKDVDGFRIPSPPVEQLDCVQKALNAVEDCLAYQRWLESVVLPQVAIFPAVQVESRVRLVVPGKNVYVEIFPLYRQGGDGEVVLGAIENLLRAEMNNEGQ